MLCSKEAPESARMAITTSKNGRNCSFLNVICSPRDLQYSCYEFFFHISESICPSKAIQSSSSISWKNSTWNPPRARHRLPRFPNPRQNQAQTLEALKFHVRSLKKYMQESLCNGRCMARKVVSYTSSCAPLPISDLGRSTSLAHSLLA
jgi:hypothetical protein